MSRIALLHPQCARLGGAIKMVLMTAHALQNEGHEVTLYTFERRDTCFPELQKGLDIRVWGVPNKKEEKGVNLATSIKDKKGGFFIFNNSSSFLFRPFFFLPQKLLNIITLAGELRHVDIIIANNPPMQIVAALAKIFSLKIKYKGGEGRNDENEGMTDSSKRNHYFSLFIFHFSLSTLWTIWWHHHTPWYYGSFKPIILVKAIFEKVSVIPFIDEIVSTSYYVADILKAYCGRKSHVIHPVLFIHPQKITHEKPINNQITMFTHGRLEEGKGLDMIVCAYQKILEKHKNVNLIVYGTGKLENFLREKGIDVRPFDNVNTFSELLSGQYGHVVGVYCSSIDAFGMASLESQMMDIPTIILDRAGARETIVTKMSGEPVGYLVDSEDELCSTVSYYVVHKMFPKQLSIVNFSHQKTYFSQERLSRDLLSLMSKTEV